MTGPVIVRNPHFINEIQKQGFVNECELKFSRVMNGMTDAILAKPEERVITLSGPTCSGKTITARNIARSVTRAGRRMYEISIDDFYRPRDEMNAEAERLGRAPDYDSVTSIDIETLAKVVRGIYEGGMVTHPLYDFQTGTRSDYITFDSSKVDVVLFEGIQAIYPEVTALFGDYPYVSISINVRGGLRVGGTEFTPRDLRLMRRIVRDMRTRGTPPERTFMLWDTTVVPNEDKSILPYEDSAQICINSLMEYEPFVARDTLIELLERIPPDSPYGARARELVEKVRPLASIDPRYVPSESMYSEFLGRE